MNGVLIIDKPAGLTSHDVVNRVRRILQQRSVGHLGTLDPMATGVLPLVTGTLTRLAQFYTQSEKTYEGTVRFGFATDTYDAEGEATTAPQPVTLSAEQVEILAARFRGVIQQTPPPFSAKKIHGVPAYKLARQQKEVVLKPVQIEIKEFVILGIDLDRARFRARVASGTYMRSIAHEMGRELGCGAHLELLRRTSVAEFDLQDAHTLEQLAAAAQRISSGGNASPRETHESEGDGVARGPVGDASPGGTQEFTTDASPTGVHESSSNASPGGTQESTTDTSPTGVRESSSNASPGGTHENSPPVLLAGRPVPNEPRPGGTPETLEDLFVHPRRLLPDLPSVTADELTAARIRSGRTVNLPELSRARKVKVFSGQRELIAIATRVAGTLFHPKIVLCGSDIPVRRP
jgi:tRNA pseudouridine55 synthase